MIALVIVDDILTFKNGGIIGVLEGPFGFESKTVSCDLDDS